MRLLPFVMLALSITGCGAFVPGGSDWSAKLPNGYTLSKNSAHQIEVIRFGSGTPPRIPAKVVELDHDSTWVIAKQQHLRRKYPDNPNNSYEEPDPGVFSYWILNTQSPQVWGPLDEQQFQATRAQLGINPALRLHSVYDYRP